MPNLCLHSSLLLYLFRNTRRRSNRSDPCHSPSRCRRGGSRSIVIIIWRIGKVQWMASNISTGQSRLGLKTIYIAKKQDRCKITDSFHHDGCEKWAKRVGGKSQRVCQSLSRNSESYLRCQQNNELWRTTQIPLVWKPQHRRIWPTTTKQKPFIHIFIISSVYIQAASIALNRDHPMFWIIPWPRPAGQGYPLFYLALNHAYMVRILSTHTVCVHEILCVSKWFIRF